MTDSSLTVSSSSSLKVGDRITITTSEGTQTRTVVGVSDATITIGEPGAWAWVRRQASRLWQALRDWWAR